jgi:predicted nucleotidyltransferase
MMKTREEVLNILRHARHDLSARYQVTRIALFGSYARGQQQEDSDIDILIDVDPSIGLRFVALANELEVLLGQRVELVTSRAIGPKMKSLLEADSIEVA